VHLFRYLFPSFLPENVTVSYHSSRDRNTHLLSTAMVFAVTCIRGRLAERPYWLFTVSVVDTRRWSSPSPCPEYIDDVSTWMRANRLRLSTVAVNRRRSSCSDRRFSYLERPLPRHVTSAPSLPVFCNRLKTPPLRLFIPVTFVVPAQGW